MTELTILTVQLIVEFAKRIPGFEKLDQEDKITLLKVKSFITLSLTDCKSFEIVPSCVFVYWSPTAFDCPNILFE